MDPMYADDINFIRTLQSKINQLKRMLLQMIKVAYKVPSQEKKWKKSKCLRSYIDTGKYIENKKSSAIRATKSLEKIFKNLSNTTKHRIFDSYVNSIFLYNQ